jgi:NADH:ubiquinone oxidoreductase subunit 4 (subunit M)
MTFFMYTLAGSVLLLAAVIALGAEALRQTGFWSFELGVLYGLHLNPAQQMFVFVAIVLACLVKCPLAPFHSWLIPAYYEAPPVASALMSGAMSKLGAFGPQTAQPLAPDAAAQLAPYLVALAVINIVYGAAGAARRLQEAVVYASLSQQGYIVPASSRSVRRSGLDAADVEPRDGDGGTLPHSRHAGTTTWPGWVHDCLQARPCVSPTAHGIRATRSPCR